VKIFSIIVFLFLTVLWGCVAEKGQPKETAQERKEWDEWYKSSVKECENYYENLSPKRLIEYAESFGEDFKREGFSLWGKMIDRCIELGGVKTLKIMAELGKELQAE